MREFTVWLEDEYVVNHKEEDAYTNVEFLDCEGEVLLTDKGYVDVMVLDGIMDMEIEISENIFTKATEHIEEIKAVKLRIKGILEHDFEVIEGVAEYSVSDFYLERTYGYPMIVFFTRDCHTKFYENAIE